MPTSNALLTAVPSSTLPKIETVLQEVTDMIPKWELVRDCLGGEEAVKKARYKYLPRPNADDTSADNMARYDAYLTRANFYNVTGRTLSGLVGQAFAIDPIIELPEDLKVLIDDVDGSGVGLESQSRKGLSYLLAYGRCGLFTDYPETDGPVTKQQQLDGDIRPNISLWSPFSIINWRWRAKGGKSVLSLVVILEKYACQDDGFEIQYSDQWRVLRLDDNNEYYQEIYRRTIPREAEDDLEMARDGEIEFFKSFYPTKADGTRFGEIPFKFVGSMDNNTAPDNPPLYDIASLNMGHYRNSADYEEACFMVGQPTPWMSGLTKKWIEEVFEGKRVYLGSRTVIPLPVDSQAGLLQVSSNSMPLEAMKLKQDQMAALGAKLVEPAQVQRTLGEARLEEATEASILVTCVKNINAAYKDALKWAVEFHGSAGDVSLQISTDFAISRLDPNERVALMNEWAAGGITTNEYRTQLRKAGIATDSDSEIVKPEHAPKATQPQE